MRKKNILYLILNLFIVLEIMSSLSFADNAFTPEKMLPAGIDEAEVTNPYTGEKRKARKGTVAATINNIALLNKLFLEPISSAVSEELIKESIEEMRKLMPSLKVIGVFNIFTPEEWLNIQDSKQWGRVTCVLLYLEKYPDIINSDIKSRIKAIEKASPPLVITNIINVLKKHLN